MNIVLTGLRGSGKTELGKILRNKLNWKLIDIDEEIEKEEMQEIPQIIKKNGWKYFRKKEKEITKKLAKLNNHIISTGGGTIIEKENAKNLKKNGIIIYLHRAPKDCLKYTKDNSNRPPLTTEKDSLKEMQKIYRERDPLYRQHAEIIIERHDDLEKDSEKIIDQTSDLLIHN